MIIFELACAAGHRFEGWFGSADDFERQRARRLLSCPICASIEVAKIPHAKIAVSEPPAQTQTLPAVDAPQTATAAAATPEQRFQAVAAFVHQVLQNTEDVGKAFPEEARRIHYDEAPARAIRGIASPAQTRELLDEGISVLPLPIPVKDDWN
jgi:hypothetical protein